MKYQSVFIVLAGIGAVTGAEAQVTSTSRSSTLVYDCLYGYADQGGGTHASGANANLLAVDGLRLNGSDGGSGHYIPNDHVWNVTYSWDLSHSYVVDGPQTNLSKIAASGSSSVSSIEQGASIGAEGYNELTLGFSVLGLQDFKLDGNLFQTGPLNRNHAEIWVYSVVGTNRIPVRIEGIQNSSFHDYFTLAPGLYEISAYSYARSNQTETAVSSYDYVLTPVPEPATLVGLGIGAFLLRRRQKLTI